jgi:hypothetical protein
MKRSGIRGDLAGGAMKQCLGHQTWIPLRFIQATTERDAPLTDDELERGYGAMTAHRTRLT